MTAPGSPREMAASLSQLLRQRLGLRGRGLSERLDHAGRRLPRRLARKARHLAEAEAMLGHPKLARQLDTGVLGREFREIAAHLNGIDPRKRHVDMALSILAGIAFDLLAVAAIVIGVLAWRGYL